MQTDVRRFPLRSIKSSYSRGPMQLWSNGGNYDVSLPIIDVKRDYLVFEYDANGRPSLDVAASKLVVRGKSWIATQQLQEDGKPTYVEANYEQRWCTIGLEAVREMLDIARRDGTVNDMRMVSRTAGVSFRLEGSDPNAYPLTLMGNEPALILQLDGSPEAMLLAQKYSFNHQVQHNIQVWQGTGLPPAQKEVTYNSGVIISRAAANAARDIDTYPTEERATSIPAGTDAENPSWEEAIKQAHVTGKLPERQRKNIAFSVQYDLNNE